MELIQTQGVAEQQRLRVAYGLESFPSPADFRATVRYELGRTCPVTLSIHDAAGRRVAELVNTRQAPGAHSATWNSADVPAGVYYCILQAGGHATTRPLVVNH